ncbi:signal peptidase I [Haloarcula sebkhae]|uniref:signal peptidase I n=1 Tax=Haloarcula sebkhae TaxID=932660 RepID=UPI001E424ABD|nr:signal peptidase I [Haloarcula sebkhae]
MLVLALIVGALVGQPVLLSFVVSGSMSPTIQEGDGFVAIPEQVAGDIEQGDVIVFQSQEIRGGELTTHRVVGETDRGYITRGDANPFTDQDGAEPPVTESQIVAVAWQPGGQVVTIPNFGTAILAGRVVVTNILTAVTTVLGVEQAAESWQAGSVMLVSGVILFAISIGSGIVNRSSRERARSRGQDTFDPRYAALFLTAIIIVPANIAMVAPSSTHQIPAGEIAAGNNIAPGEPVEATLVANNEDALVTMLVVFNGSGRTTIENRWLDVPGGETDSTALYVPAPPRGEQKVVTVSEYRYIVLLPPSVIIAMHDIHPLVALGVINAALTVAVLAFIIGLLGTSKRRVRDTDRDIPLYLRLKRKLL